LHHLEPTKALFHAPPCLDADRCNLLLLERDLLTDDDLNSGLIVVCHNLVLLAISEVDSVVLLVSSVQVELALHFTDMLIQLLLLLTLTLEPLLVALVLQGLKRQRVILEGVCARSKVY
jgi:hypothetical protein